MGVGYGRGNNRADDAFKQASCSPLMEEQVIEGAKGILINITCGLDVRLLEVDKAITKHVREKADGDANVIFGVVIDSDMHEEMKVTILATGTTQGDPNNKIQQRRSEEKSLPQNQQKKNFKTQPPYVERKGLSETVEGDDIDEIGYSEKAGIPVGAGMSSSSYGGSERGGGAGVAGTKSGLPPMSKSLFSNLRKER